MKLMSKVASALSFAHLAGVGSRARAESEDDNKKEPAERDQEDGNVKKGKKAEDDRKDKELDDDGDGQSASGDDLPDSDDGDDDVDGDKKGKKAKADDDDEDAEENDDRESEMRGSSLAAQARRREQARCAAIFASTAAARNTDLAANLAFKTRMTRKEALSVLEGTPAAAAPGNSGRAERNPKVGAGYSGDKTSSQATAARLDLAFSKVNPKRR